MSFPERWRELRYHWSWRRQHMLDRWGEITPRRKLFILGALVVVAAAAPVLAFRLMGSRHGRASGAGSRSVVLYTSVDEPIMRPIIESFEAEFGIGVKVVGDTEATKAVALLTRVLAERDAPRADVWWSSEPSTTVELHRAGLLASYSSRAELALPTGWPPHLRCPDGTWYGHAPRVRVIAFDTRKFNKTNAPQNLRALTDARFRGRIGMARPQFGSTRMHIAALV